MKKVLLAFLSFALISSAHAQFSVETIRTAEVPGFVLIKIAPTNLLRSIPTNEVFVKNYPEDQAAMYEAVMPAIGDMHGKVITPEQLKFFENNNLYRITWLGAGDADLTFRATDAESAAQDFETFTKTYLPNIYARDLNIATGENISEILPSVVPHISAEPIQLLAKFEEALPTKLQILATGRYGELITSSTLPLDDDATVTLFSDELPNLWEQLYNDEKYDITAKVSDLSLGWFPWLLGTIGVFLILWEMIRMIGRRRDEATIFPEEHLFEKEVKTTPTHVPPPVPMESTPAPKQADTFTPPPHMEEPTPKPAKKADVNFNPFENVPFEVEGE